MFSQTLITSLFYVNRELIKTDDSAPYSYKWSNLTVGNYDIIVTATDDNDVSATTSAISITAEEVPKKLLIKQVGIHTVVYPHLKSVSIETALFGI